MADRIEDLRTPAERLRWVRQRAEYDSATAAAEAMGVPVQTYLSHENGNRDLIGNAVRYALFFRVSLDWLLTGRGAPRGRSEVEELYEKLPADKRRQAMDFLEYLRGRGD